MIRQAPNNSHERNAYDIKQFKIDCIRQLMIALNTFENPQKFIL